MFESLLPEIFAAVMALAIIIYAILDGFDLGVGMQLPLGRERLAERDILIASIGPFWDANETWLVLAVGVLLIAFPSVHSLVFQALYIPTALMLVALIARGVAFEFRTKAAAAFHYHWDWVFKISSFAVALMQGYMLGQFVMGFEQGLAAIAFSVLSALGVAAAYLYIGSLWLVLKTEGKLQSRSAKMGKYSAYAMTLGIGLVCLVNPLVNPEVFARWFSGFNILLLMPIPVLCMVLLAYNNVLLQRLLMGQVIKTWLPFVLAALIFFACFQGISISFYPYLVPNKITISDAASATSALSFVFWGVAFVVPAILAYTVVIHKIFWGKATKLSYY